jgi:integrase
MVKDLSKKIPSQEDMIYKIRTLKNIEHQALASILYLTGCRVSELVKWFKVRDLSIEKEKGKLCYVFHLFTEKQRKESYRNVPLVYEEAYNKELIDMVLEYIKTKKLKDDSLLFNFSRWKAYKIIKQHFGMYPHYFREIRVTHLIKYKDFNEHKLMKYFGWTDIRPSKHYVNLDWRDLV